MNTKFQVSNFPIDKLRTSQFQCLVNAYNTFNRQGTYLQCD